MFLVFECHKIKEEKFSLHFQKILIINLVTFGSHRGLKIHIFYKTLKQYYISHNGTSYFWRIKDGYFLLVTNIEKNDAIFIFLTIFDKSQIS